MTSADTLPPEMSPSRYIEKVNLLSGEVLEEEISPKQLLVHHHRDYHPMDVQARALMARLVKATGDEELARRRMKKVRELGHKISEVVAKAVKEDDVTKISRRLFGLKRKEYYFRYRRLVPPAEAMEASLASLRQAADEAFERCCDEGGVPRLRVLLTGGTGFVGKEILWQAARDPEIEELIVLIRPKTIRDRKTKEVLQVLSPQDRGEELLSQLWLETPEDRAKFRFVAGDVEAPRLGLSDEDWGELKASVTHVIHCAASVAFDDPYVDSFRANVTGTLNALATSLELQRTAGSPFVAHLGIETSYIHGRQTKRMAREDEIVFPRNFYNNYYELTKAMASIETERFMLEEGLRVVQLCPAIVIGEKRAGNNRGDTKVVNAPVNLFGRAKSAVDAIKKDGGLVDRSKGALLANMACVFPGDPSAEINLITVDRVVEGILAALKRPAAIGERVHLATDKRVTSKEIQSIVAEELGVQVKLAEPTWHRNVTLPVLTKLLNRFKQDRLAYAMEKLGNIFGGYSEWGQPIHEVGNDVEVLGLDPERPDARSAFRMLCRHNRYVQEFGQIRDLGEVSRREKVWLELMDRIEAAEGHEVGEVSASAFREHIERHLDLESFTLRDPEAETT